MFARIAPLIAALAVAPFTLMHAVEGEGTGVESAPPPPPPAAPMLELEGEEIISDFDGINQGFRVMFVGAAMKLDVTDGGAGFTYDIDLDPTGIRIDYLGYLPLSQQNPWIPAGWSVGLEALFVSDESIVVNGGLTTITHDLDIIEVTVAGNYHYDYVINASNSIRFEGIPQFGFGYVDGSRDFNGTEFDLFGEYLSTGVILQVGWLHRSGWMIFGGVGGKWYLDSIEEDEFVPTDEFDLGGGIQYRLGAGYHF